MGIAALNPSYELCHRPETVIASEAKQSILPRKGRMDCFAALAMTVLHLNRRGCLETRESGDPVFRDVAFSRGSYTAKWCGLNSRPFSTTSTTQSAASVQRKNPVANGNRVPS